MVEVNLLPWRKLKQDRQIKERKIFFMAGVISSFILFFLIHSSLSYKIKLEKKQSLVWKNNVAALSNKFESVQLVKKQYENLKLIKQFLEIEDNKNTVLMEFFSHLSRVIPRQINLIKLSRQNSEIQIIGFSETAQALSIFLHGIKSDHKFQQARVIAIKKQADFLTLKFQIKISPVI